MSQIPNLKEGKIRDLISSKYIGLAFILMGVILRARQYATNRSLWLDEARLALNIVHRTFFDLTQPLDYNQGAPVGFLFIEKTAIQFFGNNEYILRLFPFIVSFAALFLFWKIAKRSLNKTRLFAFSLFCLSEKLIYYSSEVKQYASDVFIFLVLTDSLYECLRSDASIKDYIKLGIIGIISLWVSHPALFVSVGVVVSLALEQLFNRNWQKFHWASVIAFAWLSNFAIIYFVSLRFIVTNTGLVNYWRDYYMPIPPWSNIYWFKSTLFNTLKDPVGLPVSISIIAIVIGFISFSRRQRHLVLFLAITFLATLLASGFKKYPVGDRLLLFTVPAFYLLIAEGVEQCYLLLTKFNSKASLAVTSILALALLSKPTYHSVRNFLYPEMKENIKPVISYLIQQRENEDLIYVYYAAIPAFKYYAPFYDVKEEEYVEGTISRANPSMYISDINRLRFHKRVWLIFSHNCNWCIVNEEMYFLTYLDSVGIQEKQYISSNASIYLYQFDEAMK